MAKPSRSARKSSQTHKFWATVVLSAMGTFALVGGALNFPQLKQLNWQHISQEVQQFAGKIANEYTIPSAPPSNAVGFGQCAQLFPMALPPKLAPQPLQRELCFNHFAILHNGATKTPVFVAERMNRASVLQARSQKRTDRFYEEARLPKQERATLQDYQRSGWSRGHMAPAADMPTPEAMAQSFSLANMVPQNQEHNGKAWSTIEQDTRKYALRAKGDVYVFTGPVYSAQPKTIGNGVAIPSHLFKLVWDAQTGHAWVHWHANHPDTKVSKPISYGEFVQRTGLHLIPQAAATQLH